MIKRGLTLANAMHITASVFINDDERGLHADYEKGWKGWPLMPPSANTNTTAPAKTPVLNAVTGMPTRT